MSTFANFRQQSKCVPTHNSDVETHPEWCDYKVLTVSLSKKVPVEQVLNRLVRCYMENTEESNQ